ncbi:hypothetical protein [Dickeya sp. ws52]|uniref:hypothetical protein n=1 Tax=Dickeya sp. ws52 TaxID=2576377 RepID=UPI00117FFC1F|nr:hypothetical protein [Dickeya sp. ws52]TYL43926.1 hypothetical protein FDP13_03735 [Dickeya sp. ws52]
MNPEKKKHDNIGEKVIIDNIGINKAFQVIDRPVFIVSRHGRSRRFLSRSAAINNLAHFMVTGVFDKAHIPTHEPIQRVYVEGVLAERRGPLTERYWLAHSRCERRIRRLLSRKILQQKAEERWLKKFDAWGEQHGKLLAQKKESEKEYYALMKTRPY